MSEKTMELIKNHLAEEVETMSISSMLDAFFGDYDDGDLAKAIARLDDFVQKRKHAGGKVVAARMVGYLFWHLVASGRISMELEVDVFEKITDELGNSERVGVEILTAECSELRFKTTAHLEMKPTEESSIYALKFVLRADEP